MPPPDFEPLANESLEIISAVANEAERRLLAGSASTSDSFAVANTLTGTKAYQNLETINKGTRDGLQALTREPVIARLLIEDEEGERRTLYVSRKTPLSLQGAADLASYESPLGRIAEQPVGGECEVEIQGSPKIFYLVEKTTYRPAKTDGDWDSLNSQYWHESLGVFSIESLRALLAAEGIDAGDELDKLLEQDAAGGGVVEGLSHQLRTAMGLRDQPILDQFQGEIFRLPLSNQLMILGPPGTGKTTTLIKRLGQKLDETNLDAAERRLAEVDAQDLPYTSSWLMFTPSDLLKHYLKEAFSREHVPASDERIKTWNSYRNDIARNTLGILKTSNGGKFSLTSDGFEVAAAVLHDPREWYGAFRRFHEERLKKQLEAGAEIIATAAPDSDQNLTAEIMQWVESLASQSLLDSYPQLDQLESNIKPALDAAKSNADELLKRERNSIYNRDRQVFSELAQFLKTLNQDEDDIDEDAEFDEDEETTEVSGGDIPKAVNAYLGCLKTLARHKYGKKSLPKATRAAKIRDWLGHRLPSDDVLLKVGQSISFQNGLRRFVNASRRYIQDVPASYRHFRKEQLDNPNYYSEPPKRPVHLCTTELDAIVLLMLRNARELLLQSFVQRNRDAPRFQNLVKVESLFRHQIMVDEATDFSTLQLGCMASLTSLKTQSFFACGDFNQRITNTGIRSKEQLEWLSPAIRVKKINTVYRQSSILNDFAASLLALIEGDRSTLGILPEHSTHTGVPPVFLENAGDRDNAAQWIADRIAEVERTVNTMPTVAVLVNAEDEVRPMAEKLSVYLEDINLKAVPCEEGKALGEGTDVRVFDIKHIKGLEFEAVFFAGIDKLAEQQSDLFGRYLYVGTTRAASYLGMVCYSALPASMQSLRETFASGWID